MAISPTQPKGPYLGFEGDITPGGVLHFLDKTTDSPKSIWADEELTVPADNPITLSSDGRTPYQVYYEVGTYTVRQYELIDDSIPTPVFPADYNLVTEWVDKGLEGTSDTGESYTTVETIQELTDLVDPNEFGFVQVLGYYSGDDNIDTRTYYWDSLSVASPDGGSILPSTLFGTGRWILKTSSDVIDVRWFGAIPSSGIDSNSAIISACAFAVNSENVKPVTVYFPQGTYSVVPGTINTVATIKVDEKVEFFNRLSGDFIFNIQYRYDLDSKRTKIQQSSSVGRVIFDFTNSNWGETSDELINPLMYQSIDECFTFSGSNKVLIESNITLDMQTQDHLLKSLVFRNDAKLTLEGVFELNVSKVSSSNNYVAHFDYIYAGQQLLSFESNVVLYSAWFSSDDALKFASKLDCNLVQNNSNALPNNYSLDLSDLRHITSNGGKITLLDNVTLTLPASLTGKLISANDTSNVFISNGVYRATNFYTQTESDVLGFVRAANNSLATADFNDEVISFNIDFSGSDIFVKNATFSGILTLDNSSFESCILSSDVSSTGIISLVEVTATGTLDAISLNARNSVINCTSELNIDTTLFDTCDLLSDITSQKMDIKNCNISSTITPTPTTDGFDFFIRHSKMDGGFIVPTGNDTCIRAYIHYNDVVPQGINYSPFDDSQMTVPLTGISNISIGSYRFGVSVKGNTPYTSYASTFGSLNTQTETIFLKQTEYEVSQVVATFAIDPLYTFLVPAVNEKLPCISATVTTALPASEQVVVSMSQWVDPGGIVAGEVYVNGTVGLPTPNGPFDGAIITVKYVGTQEENNYNRGP